MNATTPQTAPWAEGPVRVSDRSSRHSDPDLRSPACRRGEHDGCKGGADYRDQDGSSGFVCCCYCHPTKTMVACHGCGGHGVLWENHPNYRRSFGRPITDSPNEEDL